MNATTKRAKYEAVRVPMSEVIADLGDPSTWDAEDEEYERSIREKSRISELPMAAGTRAKASKRAPQRQEFQTKTATSDSEGRFVSKKTGTSKPSSKKKAVSPRPARKK